MQYSSEGNMRLNKAVQFVQITMANESYSVWDIKKRGPQGYLKRRSIPVQSLAAAALHRRLSIFKRVAQNIDYIDYKHRLRLLIASKVPKVTSVSNKSREAMRWDKRREIIQMIEMKITNINTHTYISYTHLH